ncbi:hypothetical protein F4678DRAFT_346774 [Xylaria arbuscula]|nr:hypothetical protein F4678DRAFT_346774 [Xylaria arbuscula]
MPSSNSNKNKPIRPSFNATNSWIIRHARELIGYDEYDEIAREIEEERANEDYEDDFAASFASLKTGSDSHHAASGRHPAYALDEYQPDRGSGNEQKTIVENLEAIAAEMEASHFDDSDDGGSKSVPESKYPEREKEEVISSLSYRPSCCGTLSTSINSSTSNSGSESESEFLTVPRPTYAVPTRHSRAGSRESARYAYPRSRDAYTDALALAHGNEIERGLSPMPRVRATSASPPLYLQPAVTMVPDANSLSSISIPDSIYSRDLTYSNPSSRSTTKTEPRVCDSRDRYRENQNPQRAARLAVPRYASKHFVTSPFVRPDERFVLEAVIEKEEEEEREEYERRGRFK